MTTAAFAEPARIFEYYGRSVDALHVLDAELRAGRLPSDRFDPLLTPSEIDATIRDMQDELKREVSLALLASAEAVLRADFLARTTGRLKNVPRIRQEFRHLAKKWKERVPLVEIIRAWRDDRDARRSHFDALIEYQGLRDWLAHGRYWSLKTARSAEPEDVVAAVREVFAVLPGFPPI